MTLDDWRIALAPKLDGSRNLHELLPSELDFFIMLSSVVGIHGSAGQANYAGGELTKTRLHVTGSTSATRPPFLTLGGWHHCRKRISVQSFRNIGSDEAY